MEKNTVIENYTEFDNTLDKLAKDISEIFDFDETESIVYLRLLRNGPITASALAKELDFDRSGMYRIIDKMINMGIVSTTCSAPKLCIPLPPNDLLKLIIHKKEDSLNNIKNNGQDILQSIEKITKPDFSSNVPIFRTIHDRENVFFHIGQIIENSSGVIYIIATLEDISKMYHSNIPDKITICEKNGGQVRLLTNMKDSNLTSFVTRLGATEVRISNIQFTGRIVIEKARHMIMSDIRTTNKSQNNKLDFSLYINSLDIINNIQKMCEYLWEVSKPINTIDIMDFNARTMSDFTLEHKYKELFELKELKQENILLYSILEDSQ